MYTIIGFPTFLHFYILPARRYICFLLYNASSVSCYAICYIYCIYIQCLIKCVSCVLLRTYHDMHILHRCPTPGLPKKTRGPLIGWSTKRSSVRAQRKSWPYVVWRILPFSYLNMVKHSYRDPVSKPCNKQRNLLNRHASQCIPWARCSEDFLEISCTNITLCL